LHTTAAIYGITVGSPPETQLVGYLELE